MPLTPTPPIDAVITWVDGADPAHLAKRHALMAQGGDMLHANGTNPHRWGSSDEVVYCLRSIANNAPWLRRIWVVTDGQIPDLTTIPAATRARVTIVDHRQIFRGFDECLPTFNSLSIESMVWRIPGLSDRFLYFNDDVFLTAPLSPDDVFDNGKPVLRGKWVDYSDLCDDAGKQHDPAFLNHYTQMNAARLAGFQPRRMWASAHVVHPLRRSVLAALFDRHIAEFRSNIGHKFRDLGQFQPMALHNHTCIRSGNWMAAQVKDYLHLRSGAVIDFPPEEVRAFLRRSTLPEAKFLCVNDLPQVEAVLPDTRDWIERAIGA
jgi:hypothetical protein